MPFVKVDMKEKEKPDRLFSETEDFRKNIERARTPREYTIEELDRLYDAVEKAAINDDAIELHHIKDVLLPGDFTLSGFGASAGIETLFEIKGLRWSYEGEIFSALLSPQVRFRGIPCVEWYVSLTLCESGKYAGATWNQTYMLRKNYRVYASDIAGKEGE